MAGYNYEYNPLPYMFEVDSTGSVIWSKTLDSLGVAMCIRHTRDGGYVVTGASYSPSAEPDQQRVLLAKLSLEQTDKR